MSGVVVLNLGDLESFVESIKDTDGIKKITDALPAGDNNIGNVDVVSSTLPTGAATETTLSSVDGKLTTIDAVLDTIDAVLDTIDAKVATETTLAGVKINLESVVDSGNSSTSQLGNGGTFVGTGVDCLGFASIAVTIHSDKDSSTDGMKFQFSINNTNWDDSYSWTLDASASETRRFQFPVTARYFRVNYTNGTQATSEFRVQTILHRQNILTSIHRLKDNASQDRSAQIVKAAIIAQRAGGPSQDFIPVEADPGGNLKTALGDSIPSGDNNIGNVDVVSSTLPTGAATETTLSSIDSKATTIDAVLDTIDAVLDSIKDTDGIKKITDALPIGDNIVGRVKITDGTNVVDVVEDDEDGIKRLQIKGKVSVSAPQTPPSATAVSLASDTPLSINTTSESSYVIPDGKTFTVTSVTAGAEGDPTEKGSKVEVIYDQNGTEKVIDRLYLTGQTVPIYPDTSQARDGTSLDGNAGGTNKIILRRIRLSGVAQEVDAVLRGYIQDT